MIKTDKEMIVTCENDNDGKKKNDEMKIWMVVKEYL